MNKCIQMWHFVISNITCKELLMTKNGQASWTENSFQIQLPQLNKTFPVKFFSFFLVCGCDTHNSIHLYYKKKGRKEKVVLNLSCWIWQSHLLVWGSTEVEAHTRHLLVSHRRVSQAQGRSRGKEGKRHGGREGWKEKQRVQTFLRTVFIELGSFRFISHYSWVLSQA